MPSEPRAFAIVTSLRDALRAMASDPESYHHPIEATAVKLDPNHDAERLVDPDGPRPYVTLEVRPQADYEYRPSGDVRITQGFTAHWVCGSDATDDASLLQTYLEGCADVERAITRDTARGGLAVDTRITGTELVSVDDTATVYARIDIEVIAHRTYGDPGVPA